MIEIQNCLKSKKLVELSEQQLVDCDSANEGCCGGVPAKALEYVTRNGVMGAKDYEYSEKVGAFNRTILCSNVFLCDSNSQIYI